ncbi:uncharacterized protein LOC105184321 [Harpegnathos saltator]|uniref:uncharacterized protein LOC105184321 n=1 Tax=Harpegnathos saltator TaxID=610380 RepID=UPI000DBEE98D|nr:uncharacterized protein LOC105184321 [Harpegnathos saltator]XP_011141335.2 uncharacterized protein LOC105184321 [Harpegnathos saltator]
MADDEQAGCSNNAQLFRIAISHSLRSIAESVSEDEFVEILSLTTLKSKTAKKLHQAMVQELYRGMNGDLEAMLDKGALQDAFIKAAKLSEDSMTSADENAWRPPGDVALHLRSLDVHTIKKATEELEERLNEVERENDTLIKTIADSRLRIRTANNNVAKILDYAPVILQRLEKTYEQLTTCLRANEN